MIYKIKNRDFNFNTAYCMGILNVTPDSFSDGGKFYSYESAYDHAEKMINDGVDIIDIGGESTRPGSDEISTFDELERVLPVIKRINSNYPDAIISIDTTKSIVAEEALKVGASIINDISAGAFDVNMFNVAAKYQVAYIAMHIRGKPKDMQLDTSYKNLIEDIKDFLKVRISLALHAGIEQIIIDPGIGFGKDSNQNLELIKNLKSFESFGYPILVGLSKKSFIGSLYGYPLDGREVPSAILDYECLKNGARIIRCHNVKYGVAVCKIFNSLRK